MYLLFWIIAAFYMENNGDRVGFTRERKRNIGVGGGIRGESCLNTIGAFTIYDIINIFCITLKFHIRSLL